MSPIGSIPTSRVGDLLIRSRLLAQLQFDQRELLRIQTQVSTGRRISLPSQDAPAALRAISLQSLIERKTQVATSLQTNASYLSTTDVALSSVSGTLADILGEALSAIDTTIGDTTRETIINSVDSAIEQLISVGNQSFRGRFLFTGTQTTTQPFTGSSGFVRYNGNEGQLRSYSDIDVLFETSIDGNQVFGALSTEVQGAVDLNPVLTANTVLADLRNGSGIGRGSVAISDGTNSTIVDLSNAATLGDVARFIETNPPAGRQVVVTITATGLQIDLDAAGGGNLTINEVAGGTTADELGILEVTGVGTGPLLGSDLNPVLKLTTPVADLLGTRSSARVVSLGQNNDLIFSAKTNGTQFDGFTVQFVDDPAVAAGSEVVVYDTIGKTLTFRIDEGATLGTDIVAALAADVAASADFQATVDIRDASGTGLAGSGAISATATATTSGGSGSVLDSTGIQVSNGGKTFNLSFAGADTVEDVLNILNVSDADLLAEINTDGTRINIRSRLSGADFSIGELGGTTATQLGIRTFTDQTKLADLNHDLGVHTITGTDFTIQRNDGTLLNIDVSTATTINDVINLINTAAGTTLAQLAAVGNGIELIDNSASAPGPITINVQRPLASLAAVHLGLIPKGATQSDPSVASGGGQVLTGADVNPLKVDGIFDSLIRLRQALVDNDVIGIGNAHNSLDDAATQLDFARSEIGSRLQRLDVVQERLAFEQVELQSALSLEIDTDFTEAISEMTARQFAFQASLQTSASILQITLLNFL